MDSTVEAKTIEKKTGSSVELRRLSDIKSYECILNDLDNHTRSTVRKEDYINIVVHNQTPLSNIVILVFARYYPIPITEESLNMAWKTMMIPPKGSTQFPYPVKDRISAYVYNGKKRISAGPYDATIGTTWEASALSGGEIKLEQKSKAIGVNCC